LFDDSALGAGLTAFFDDYSAAFFDDSALGAGLTAFFL
jgi:hypothetical protein